MATLAEKTQKLIACVKALKLEPQAEAEVLERIRFLTNTRETDVNKILTRIIFFEIISKRPEILDNLNSHALKEFCLKEVDRIQSPSPQPRSK